MRTTQLLRPLRPRRVRRSAVRLGGIATAGALAATLALVAPAQATDPAVATEAGGSTTFDLNGSCALLTGGDMNNGVTKNVPSSGTKKVNVAVSGTATAQSMSDSSDTVTMTATNTVTGSITGAGGGFRKAALTIRQAGSVTMALGFASQCSPAVGFDSGANLLLTVKKAGTLSMHLDLPRDTIVSLTLDRGSDPQVMTLAYNARGSYNAVHAVSPGAYLLQIESVVDVGFGSSTPMLSHDGAVAVSLGYAKS